MTQKACGSLKVLKDQERKVYIQTEKVEYD
jgi:hypothetical protein